MPYIKAWHRDRVRRIAARLAELTAIRDVYGWAEKQGTPSCVAYAEFAGALRGEAINLLVELEGLGLHEREVK